MKLLPNTARHANATTANRYANDWSTDDATEYDANGHATATANAHDDATDDDATATSVPRSERRPERETRSVWCILKMDKPKKEKRKMRIKRRNQHFATNVYLELFNGNCCIRFY